MTTENVLNNISIYGDFYGIVRRYCCNNISVMRVGFDSFLDDNVVIVDNLEITFHRVIPQNIAVPEAVVLFIEHCTMLHPRTTCVSSRIRKKKKVKRIKKNIIIIRR